MSLEDDIRNKGTRDAVTNKKFIQKLKKNTPPDLDATSAAFHDEVFLHTDCLACANCCKTTSPIFYERDVERIASYLKVRPADFVSKYLRVDEDRDYVLKTAPCPFLGTDNRCSVYEHRPNACREYPHTKRKRFHQVLDLALKNTMVCPAVQEIITKLRSHY